MEPGFAGTFLQLSELPPPFSELTVKQEGREQVCEQETAQTGHLQFSGTPRAPRTAEAARRPGALLPGNRRGAARALRCRLQPWTTRRGDGTERDERSRAGTQE